MSFGSCPGEAFGEKEEALLLLDETPRFMSTLFLY
jgi:hypothetical protein